MRECSQDARELLAELIERKGTDTVDGQTDVTYAPHALIVPGLYLRIPYPSTRRECPFHKALRVHVCEWCAGG